MKKIFGAYALKYFEMGYNVIPTSGKIPLIKGWQNRVISEEELEALSTQRPFANIGLVCGQRSGVIAIDVDIEGLEKIIPYSPCERKGKKGFVRFFKYTGQRSQKFHEFGVEILSNGNQVILPPSIHPETKKAYLWSSETSLLEINPQELPSIDVDELIKKIKTLLKPVETKRNTNGSLQTTGRHNKLTSIAFGMVSNNIPIDQMITELENYDKQNHKPPYFSDPSETISKSPSPVEYFVLEKIKSHVNRGGFYTPDKILIDAGRIKKALENNIAETNIVKELSNPQNQDKYSFIHFRGIGQDLFKYIYNNSHIKRTRFSIASALSVGSIAIGNKFTFNGMAANMYITIIGKSGSGKNYPLRFPYKILKKIKNSKLIGKSQIVSNKTATNDITQKPCRIDCIDEFGKILKHSENKSGPAGLVADIYNELYSQSGSSYDGTQISNPSIPGKILRYGYTTELFISLLGAMTPEAVKNNMSIETWNSGLGSRLMVYVDTKWKDDLDFYQEEEIPKHILDWFSFWTKLEVRLQNIPISQCGMKAYIEIKKLINNKKKKTDTQEVKKQIAYNRFFEKVQKLAMVDLFFTVGQEMKPEKLEIRGENLWWGYNHASTLFNELESFLDDMVEDDKHQLSFEEDLKRIASIIKSQKKECNGNYLANRFRKTSSYRKILIKELEERDIIHTERIGKKSIYTIKKN